MADGDSDANRQAFTNFGAGPFDDIKGKMLGDPPAMKWYCGCDKAHFEPYSHLEGDQQDATGFALRLHGAQSTWKFRCNNQPGFAMCSPVIEEEED